MSRLNWHRSNTHPRGEKTGLNVTHTTGWRVQHCGHPTANQPYELTDPFGRLVVAPNGLAFRTLAGALDVASALIAGFWQLEAAGEDVGGLRAIPPHLAAPRRTLGLVACCGPKLSKTARAAELYTSPLFRKSRAYVERNCDAWAILSAKHGLVQPFDMVSPYDQTLSKMPAAERRSWAAGVRAQLVRLRPVSFVVLAGVQYRAAFEGLPHSAPMAGLGIGHQLAWLGGSR